jgi:hypothetical protein
MEDIEMEAIDEEHELKKLFARQEDVGIAQEFLINFAP